MPWRRLLADERVRFILIGGINTLIGYLMVVLMYWLTADYLHYTMVVVVAYVFAAPLAFLNQRHFTFRANGNWLGEFWRYNVSQVSTLLLGLALLAALVEGLRLHPLVAQALNIVVSTVLSYLLHRYYSFAPR